MRTIKLTTENGIVFEVTEKQLMLLFTYNGFEEKVSELLENKVPEKVSIVKKKLSRKSYVGDRFNKGWNASEDAKVKSMYRQGSSDRAIAMILGRTRKSVAHRRMTLGCVKFHRRTSKATKKVSNNFEKNSLRAKFIYREANAMIRDGVQRKTAFNKASAKWRYINYGAENGKGINKI